MEAGTLITAKEAERRVLILENPGLRGQSRITHSLYAGLQLILPGEVAPAHRHTPSALRFIVEGEGAYTAVDGEKTIMQEGDFVITPSWTWHDHGNESDRPMVWLDGLDVPLVEMLDASFAEMLPQDEQRSSRPSGLFARRKYGDNVRAGGLREAGQDLADLQLSLCPHARGAGEDAQIRAAGCLPRQKLRYVNPTTGDFAMPTIGTFMQLLPKGFETAPYRSTDGTVYSPVEGKGRTVVGDQAFEWRKRDMFVVPSWASRTITRPTPTRCCSASPTGRCSEKLGLWREQRGNEAASAPH